MENGERFKDFLFTYNKAYSGDQYRLFRFLLFDHLSIAELAPENIIMRFCNELADRGLISYNDVKLLSEIAELTMKASAKSCTAEYISAVGDKYNDSKGESLTLYRRTLFIGLNNINEGDLHQLIERYDLKSHNFNNRWDVVFYLETEQKLRDKQEEWERFANILNSSATGILLDYQPSPTDGTGSGGPATHTRASLTPTENRSNNTMSKWNRSLVLREESTVNRFCDVGESSKVTVADVHGLPTRLKTKHVDSSSIFKFSNAEHRVRELLLGKSKTNITFDLMYNTILVVNNLNKEIEWDLNESFGFISKVKWKAVFDFDSRSNNDGICKEVRSKQNVILSDINTILEVTPPEISYADDPIWIFSNGRSDMEEVTMDSMDWIKNRSSSMDRAIELFADSNVMGCDRSLIIFLLLSNNTEVLSETFRKFYAEFGIDRIVFISESKQVFDKWCSLVSRYCKPKEIHDRAIVGVLWKSVNDIMLRMQGVNVKSKYILPTVDDGGCFLWEKYKSKWNDLSVITYNECENTDMNEKHPNFREFCKEKELEFYRGEKLTFWNFKLDNHVCQRDTKHKMVKKVDMKIKQPKNTNQAVFHWFHLYHQPGAGGSTVAKHVLWEFRKKYRCVILKKISDKTESQILQFWSYGEGDGSDKKQYLPLVIVSDNLCYEDLADMVLSLEYSNKNIPGRMCVILNCTRYLSQIDIKIKESASSCFFLEQTLSDEEKDWFQSKHNELEKLMENDKDFTPDRLLAFMVMKEEFKAEYIETIVSRVLSELNEQHPNEFKLVQVCALFSKFERDSAIPILCCDDFMGFAYSTKEGTYRPWEYDRSDKCSLLMSTVQIHDIGSAKGFRIVHPKVADCILNDATSEPLSTIVTQYLDSKLLTAKTYCVKYLAQQTRNMLIKRNQTGPGHFDKRLFSDLILEIKNVDKEAACDVLIKGFKILKDPIIAQQISRYYNLVMEDNIKAFEFIENAISMKRDDSFFWDAKGQIYVKELHRSFYSTYYTPRKRLSIDDSCKLLQLGFDGISSFHTSQRCSRGDNTSCFSGEVNITFKMLDVLTCLDIFQKSSGGLKILQNYLINKSYCPDELVKWDKHHKAMKELVDNLHVALDTMANYYTFNKDWSNFTKVNKPKAEDLKRKVTDYLQSWEKYFGSIEIDQKDLPIETQHDLRRIQARNLGGHGIGQIFELVTKDDVKNLLGIRKLLLENNPHTAFDLRTIILTNFALSATTKKKKVPTATLL